MAITKELFGQVEGGEVYKYTLCGKSGLIVEILNLGGIIRSIITKDKNGNDVDVVLGRETLEEYKDNKGYLGAAVGRHANRIEDSRFTLNGIEYKVGANEGRNSLHGGFIGFGKKLWSVTEADGDEPSLIMSLVSPDGEEGFPGTLSVTMTYTVTSKNSLKIHYFAISDKDTVCNMTNHSYFNLSGHDSGTVYDQILQLNSSFYTPNCSECMPTGEVDSVTGTPFDFRVPKPIGQDINADFEQIEMFGGYDHNFAFDGRGFRLFGTAKSLETGISMEIYSDQSAMQLYTANALAEGVYKGGAHYGKHNAFCLETQCFPNAMKHSHFPGPVLKKNEAYDTVTEYLFKTE